MTQLVELQRRLHIYDEPVPEGMVATQIAIAAPEAYRPRPFKNLATRTLHLEALGVALQVWDGQVDFVIPVSADDRIVSLIDGAQMPECEFKLDIEYQACNNQTCPGSDRSETF